MLALHLRQSSLVDINTLLLEAVLEVPEFHDGIGPDERRALSPLFWTHVNPYGRFRLDMDTRIDLTSGQPAAESILYKRARPNTAERGSRCRTSRSCLGSNGDVTPSPCTQTRTTSPISPGHSLRSVTLHLGPVSGAPGRLGRTSAPNPAGPPRRSEARPHWLYLLIPRQMMT